MRREQRGFTLIELVIVIVILGLLAATALPRFIDLTSQARLASVQGIAGGLAGATSLAKAQWLVNGSTSATSVVMDGLTVTTNTSGYPTADANGIIAAMQGSSGGVISGYTFTPAGAPLTGQATLWPVNGGSGTCDATYTANTGTVTINSGTC